MFARKLAATAMALALATAMCPGPALADMTAATVGAQATSTVKVKVLAQTKKDGKTTKYTYNGNGLLAKYSDKYTTGKYTYSGTKLKKYVQDGSASKDTSTYTCDGKGRVTGQSKTSKSKYGSSVDKSTYTYKYDSKGRVKSGAMQWTDGAAITSKFSYDGKGGIKKVAVKEGFNDAAVTIKYNKNGDMASYSRASEMGYGQYYEYKYAYKDGSPSKCAIKSTLGDSTKTFSYKTISVPKGMAAKVKRQQWELVNYQAVAVDQYPAALTI